MELSSGILFGIVAMLAWGTSDFFIAMAVRKSSVIKTFLWSTVTTAAGLAVLSRFFKFPVVSYYAISIFLVTGFLSTIAWLAFYKGLRVGKVSIISPIANSWPLVTVLLSISFLGETLTKVHAVGAGLAILGGILTAFKLKDIRNLNLANPAMGVKYALAGMLGWGVYFVFIDILVAQLNWFFAAFFTKFATIFYLVAYSGAAKKEISFPKNIASLVILSGFLEIVAFLSYNYGITSEYTAMVSPIIAATPMATIFLARIFFREMLEINQKIGVASVLMGLVLLAM